MSQPTTVAATHHHAPPQGFLRTHVFSLDPKVIGKQYLDLALVAVCTGMVLSWLMRLHLAWPETPIPGLEKLSPNGAAGGVITPEYYLSLMTMHGTIMVFFVLTTAPFAGFGNYFLPIQVGAEDMAFPRINMASFWVTLVAFLVLISSFFVHDGPALSGWTAYAPLSAVGKDAGPGQGAGQTLWAVSIAIFCVAQLLGALNFIATTLDLRTRGMSLARMPFSTWAWFITAVIGLIAFAVLMPACILLILDRVAGTSFFIPAGLVISDRLQPHAGGSPLLWQHLFWFFGHPEVYIAILPGVRLRVRERWDLGILPGAAVDRCLSARHLFRGGAFPLCDGRRRHVRHLRRDLFLVPQDVRSPDERDAGQVALLADVHRRVLRLHADALPRPRRQRAPLFGVHGRLPEAPDPAAPVHHGRRALHRRRAADFPVQPAPEPLPGAQGPGQSLGGHHARVVHHVAAAVRQLRRPPSGGAARSERVRREGCGGGLRDAGRSLTPHDDRRVAPAPAADHRTAVGSATDRHPRAGVEAGRDRSLGRHRDHLHVVRGAHQRHGGAAERRAGLATLPAASDSLLEHADPAR